MWRCTARSAGVVLVLLSALAVSGCELALYGYEKAVGGGCAAWHSGCPIVVDAAGDGPVQGTSSDADRAAIVEAAEAAPVRQCTTVPLLCQATTTVDVVVEHYFMVF